MSFFSEFKDFAVRGNVLDMAIGVVIGGAFGQITTVLPRAGLVVSIQCPETGDFERVKQALHESVLDKL